MTRTPNLVLLSQILFIGIAALSLLPFFSSSLALLSGILLGLTLGNPFTTLTHQLTSRILQASIIGLGAGIQLTTLTEVGSSGIGYTLMGIFITLALGLALNRLSQADDETSLLITIGTAICGGSAIAALSSAIRAKPQNTSIALATVFILNAVALFIFPIIGHYFELSPRQFGLWSAIAIHDTSSVVGASLQYGAEALAIATPVKLARALWIIPCTFVISHLWSKKNHGTHPGVSKKPWFILWFLLTAALVTWIPALQPLGMHVHHVAQRTLVLTLFLIGTGLSKATLKHIGIRPMLQGLCLWILISAGTLAGIQMSWIR